MRATRFRGVGLGITVFVGLAASARAQATDTIQVGLAEAERIALERSPVLESSLAAIELSRAQEDQASRVRFLPEASLRNVWGPVPRLRGEFTDTGVLISPDTATGLGDLTWFTQVDLNLVQPLYTFGKIGSRIDAARFQTEATQADLERIRSELLMQVRELYWGVVLSDELARLSSGVDQQVQEAETRLQELYDEGTATQNDLFKFELFKYEVNSQTREVEATRDKAVAGLRALLGLDERVVLRLETESLEELDFTVAELSEYVELARSGRPELRQLEAGINARRALVRASRADTRPTLFAAGRFSLNQSPGRFDPRNPFVHNPTNFSRPALLVGIDWNLNFWQNSVENRIEQLELDGLRARARPLRLMIDQQVREAYLDLVRARDDIEDGRSALRASQNLLRAELQTFDLGIGSIDDVIDAFKANVGMSAVQFRNLARFNTKLAELSARVGQDLSG